MRLSRESSLADRVTPDQRIKTRSRVWPESRFEASLLIF